MINKVLAFQQTRLTYQNANKEQNMRFTTFVCFLMEGYIVSDVWLTLFHELF